MSSNPSIRILTSEALSYGASSLVAFVLPCIDLAAQGLAVCNTPVQALPGQYSDLDFGHVQPTGMLGCVVKLDSAQQPGGSPRSQDVFETLSEVGVQVVQDQVHPLGPAIDAPEQPTDELHEVRLTLMFGHGHDSTTSLGFDCYEQIRRPVTPIKGTEVFAAMPAKMSDALDAAGCKFQRDWRLHPQQNRFVHSWATRDEEVDLMFEICR